MKKGIMQLGVNNVATALLVGLGMAVLVTSVAVSQDTISKPKQDEKKSAPKAIEVHFKVSVKGGGSLPANTKIEISGHDAACGSLQALDATSVIDKKGEAVFKDLPSCKITIKVNQIGYIVWKTIFDLADYKEPIQIALEREH